MDWNLVKGVFMVELGMMFLFAAFLWFLVFKMNDKEKSKKEGEKLTYEDGIRDGMRWGFQEAQKEPRNGNEIDISTIDRKRG